MARELFSRDDSGMTVWYDYNELTDEVTLEYEQDAEPILEMNKKLQNDPSLTKEGFKNEFYLLASIPNGVQMKWLLEEGLDLYDKNAWPQVVKKLNDPQYQYLRTTTARYGAKVFRG